MEMLRPLTAERLTVVALRVEHSGSQWNTVKHTGGMSEGLMASLTSLEIAKKQTSSPLSLENMYALQFIAI